jgi:anaerobic sulfite reductase subunit C
MPDPTPRPLKGVVRLKDATKVAVRIRVTGGAVTADLLATVTDLARRYSDGQVHLTTRQGIEIAPVDLTRAEDICAELDAAGIPRSALGPSFRGVVACPGSACRNGVIDAQGLAQRIDAAFADFEGLHAKVKAQVAGCPNGCPKPTENDLGVVGVAKVTLDAEACSGCQACEARCKVGAIPVEDGSACHDGELCIDCGGCAVVCPTGAVSVEATGYRLYAGGKMGRFPRLGAVVADWLDTEDDVLAAISDLLTRYRDEGHKGERLGDWLGRVS